MRALRRLVDRIALRDREFRFLFRNQETDEAVSLDCETTGFDPWIDEIVSIAAIRIHGSRILTSEDLYGLGTSRSRDENAVYPGSSAPGKGTVETGRPMEDVLPELRLLAAGHWLGTGSISTCACSTSISSRS